MNLHLLIPALFWPDTSQKEIYHDLSVPSLEVLLSKSTLTTNPPQDIDSWLCQTFNIAQQQGHWPIAPITLNSDDPSLLKNNQDFWMRADPVHLRIEHNHIMLADSRAFHLSAEEAKQITQDLNKHFCNDDLIFLPLHPDRWYIRTPHTPEMFTYTLNQVTCNNINNFLPAGKDSAIWHRIFNEIQMILHEHPINQAREARGELIINSVWFWGGGKMPVSAQSPYTHIYSNNELLRALALSSKVQHYAELPVGAAIWQATNTSGNYLIVLDALLGKSKYKDAYGWRENLRIMEKDWFLPLLTALKEGTIDHLTITALNEYSSQQDFMITRSNLWKFWLAAKPFPSFAVI